MFFCGVKKKRFLHRDTIEKKRETDISPKFICTNYIWDKIVTLGFKLDIIITFHETHKHLLHIQELLFFCNRKVCVVHFMCSGTLKCLIQHSSEPAYCNVLFMNCYVCVVHFIDTVILQ